MQFMETYEPSKYSYINAAGTRTHSYRPKMTKTTKNDYTHRRQCTPTIPTYSGYSNLIDAHRLLFWHSEQLKKYLFF